MVKYNLTTVLTGCIYLLAEIQTPIVWLHSYRCHCSLSMNIHLLIYDIHRQWRNQWSTKIFVQIWRFRVLAWSIYIEYLLVYLRNHSMRPATAGIIRYLSLICGRTRLETGLFSFWQVIIITMFTSPSRTMYVLYVFLTYITLCIFISTVLKPGLSVIWYPPII